MGAEEERKRLTQLMKKEKKMCWFKSSQYFLENRQVESGSQMLLPADLTPRIPR